MAKLHQTAWTGVSSASTTMRLRMICVYLVANMRSTEPALTNGFRLAKITVQLVGPRVYHLVLNRMQLHNQCETAQYDDVFVLDSASFVYVVVASHSFASCSIPLFISVFWFPAIPAYVIIVILEFSCTVPRIKNEMDVIANRE